MMNCVLEESGINLLQRCCITKQDVGGIFALTQTPIIGLKMQIRFSAQKRMNMRGQLFQPSRPSLLVQTIEQLLGSFQVVDAREAVVMLFVTDTLPVQLPTQPLPPLRAPLIRNSGPGWQAACHQTIVPAQLRSTHR